MLGPLPRLHRLLIIAAAIAVFVGLGAWLGAIPSMPVLVSSGATAGIVVGMMVAWLLVHEPHRARGALRQRRR